MICQLFVINHNNLQVITVDASLYLDMSEDILFMLIVNTFLLTMLDHICNTQMEGHKPQPDTSLIWVYLEAVPI